MASILPPSNGSPLAVIQPQEVEDNNSKPGWFSLIFSNEVSFKDVASSYFQLCGKVILAGVCLIITDLAIDRFSPPAYRTVLKVILVVATIGFIISSFKRFIESLDNRAMKEKVKEDKKKDEEIDRIASEALSVITNHLELTVNQLDLFSEYEKRIELWKGKKSLIDSIEKMQSLQDDLSRMSELTKQLLLINDTIRPEIGDETLPKDREEIVQMLPAVTEHQSKLLDAGSQRFILLRGIIACYDEILKKIDQFKEEKN